MIEELKNWIRWNRPRVTTAKRDFLKLTESSVELIKAYDVINRKAIGHVISSLERLRANTWDQDAITDIQKWLREIFEEENND